MLAAIALAMSPIGRPFGFVALPLPILVAILLITSAYVVVSEWTKRLFYRHLGGGLRYG
jgi:Mg2+-importing ATPase